MLKVVNLKRYKLMKTITEEESVSLSDSSREVQIRAIVEDPTLIQFIENPAPELQVLAVSMKPSVLHLIEKPCLEAHEVKWFRFFQD